MSLLIDSTGVVSAMLNDALTQYVRDRFLSAGGNSPATVTEVTTLENEQALQPKQAAPQVAASALGSGVPNPVLHMFDSQTHVFSSEEKANLSVLSKIFGASAKRFSIGIIRETKRFAVVRSSLLDSSQIDLPDSAKTIEIGCSVRLLVAASKIEGTAEVSIPNIAAQAQLGHIDAQVGISIVGYTGPIGEFMPDVAPLNVESYTQFLDTFRALEQRIFSAENERFIFPAPLWFPEVDET
jgi:hypothetical protein